MFVRAKDMVQCSQHGMNALQRTGVLTRAAQTDRQQVHFSLNTNVGPAAPIFLSNGPGSLFSSWFVLLRIRS